MNKKVDNRPEQVHQEKLKAPILFILHGIGYESTLSQRAVAGRGAYPKKSLSRKSLILLPKCSKAVIPQMKHNPQG